MGNGSLDCRNAGAYDTFEWKQVFRTKIGDLYGIKRRDCRKWRKKELIDFQMMIHSTRNRTICRMGLALLYAHFEGFIKKAANYYIVFVSSQNLKISELKINFAAIFCQGNLSSCSETNKLSVYSNILHTFLDSYENFNFNIRYSEDKPIIKTGGNPSSLVFKEILNSIGLDFSIYETKQKYIDTDLLSNRHGIVHGEKIYILQKTNLMKH